MMQITREHNVLTGYRFVTFEYLAVSLVLAVLGAYYVAAARWLDAAVWFGIVANCLVIAGFAAAALRAGAADYGSLPHAPASVPPTDRSRASPSWSAHRHPRNRSRSSHSCSCCW